MHSKRPSEGEPAAFMPWYAAEYGLAEFAPYFESVPELVSEGRPWLFTRGTAASVLRALAWVGFDAAKVEESWRPLAHQSWVAKPRRKCSGLPTSCAHPMPAHVQFWRVFHGHDRRTLRLDRDEHPGHRHAGR